MRAYVGHGFDAARVCGGSGSSSKFVTLFAPWRIDVPIQSLPGG
jgi:hypothetical protein